MLVVHIIIALSFVVLGIVFSKGKGAGLIAGYNTSSATKRSKYNEIALCKFMGKIMFALAGSFAIMALSDVINNMIPLWIGLGLFFAMTVFAVVYSNANNRFKK